MSQLPDLTTHASLTDVAYLVDGSRSIQAKDVTAASGQTSAITPDHRHPPGTVLGYRTSTGKYELADSGSVRVNTPAYADALETADTDWQSATITVTVNGQAVVVTLGAGDDTDAEVVAALNADAGFAGVAFASVVASVVRVSARSMSDHLTVVSSLATAFGATALASEDPVYGIYRVTTAFYDLKDIDGTAVDALAHVLEAGHFDESELSSLTNDARAALLAQGSKFS